MGQILKKIEESGEFVKFIWRLLISSLNTTFLGVFLNEGRDFCGAGFPCIINSTGMYFPVQFSSLGLIPVGNASKPFYPLE